MNEISVASPYSWPGVDLQSKIADLVVNEFADMISSSIFMGNLSGFIIQINTRKFPIPQLRQITMALCIINFDMKPDSVAVYWGFDRCMGYHALTKFSGTLIKDKKFAEGIKRLEQKIIEIKNNPNADTTETNQATMAGDQETTREATDHNIILQNSHLESNTNGEASQESIMRGMSENGKSGTSSHGGSYQTDQQGRAVGHSGRIIRGSYCKP